MCSLWSLTQPLYGSPDESAHVVRAVAAGHLQFSGEKTKGDFGFDSEVFRVPQAYSQGLQYLACILGPQHAAASCLGPFASGSNQVEIASTAAHYPPTYYALVGPVGNLFPNSFGFYAMRIFSSLLSSLLAAWAFGIAMSHGSRTRLIGVAVALSPMTFSLSGAVNPHGLEIFSAILFWVSCLTIFDLLKSVKEVTRHLNVALIVSVFLFATIRPASFYWMIPSLFIMIAFSGPKEIFTSIIRSRQGKMVVCVLASGISLSVLLYWLSGVGTSLAAGSEPGYPTLIQNLEIAFDRGDDYFRYMFGWFGWVEFAAPPLAFYLCIAALVITITYSSFVANKRKFFVVIFALTMTFVIPIITEGVKANVAGFGYQGRYTLAFEVGVPIIAMWIPALKNEFSKITNFLLFCLATSSLASLICLNFALQRYTVGETGPKLWFVSPDWLPPGGFYLLVPLILVALFSIIYIGISLIRTDEKVSLAHSDLG